MCLFVIFFLFMFFSAFFARGVLELFWTGNLTASFFCKSKDFKAFLRCSCVHFFLFVFAIITIIICIFKKFLICKEKNNCVPKGSMTFGVKNEEGIHL